MYVCPPSYYCMFVPTTALCFSSHKQIMFVPPILYVSPPLLLYVSLPPQTTVCLSPLCYSTFARPPYTICLSPSSTTVCLSRLFVPLITTLYLPPLYYNIFVHPYFKMFVLPLLQFLPPPPPPPPKSHVSGEF